MSWYLSGTYVESCNCESACPCVFLSDPTHGDCTVLVGWHVEQGTYEGLPLDGFPMGFEAVDGTRRLTLGEVADLEVHALEGQAGGSVTIDGHPLAIAPGHPAVAASSDRLRYRDHGRSWSLSERTAFFSPFTYEP